MKRVLISDNLSVEGIEIFKKTPGIEVDIRTKMTPDELKAVIKDYDALVIRSATKVTKEVIDLADKLVIIGRAGIGLDNVDIPAATKRGIVVMNTPGGNAVTTGEHTIAMMLSLVRHIPQATASMKAGKWEKNKFTGHEFLNKTLGIIGIGRVGSIVADRAQGLKMNVIAFDPFITPEAAEKAGITLATLDEIYAQADVITIHTPMTKETRGLVNAAAFARMKKGVYIVNCARGGLVSEKDLYDALVAGKVAGAALDVFEEEPPKNTALISLDNVICTPHLGASTDEAQINVAVAIAEQVSAYLTTGEIRAAANFPSVSGEILAVLRPYLNLAEKLGAFAAHLVEGAIKGVTIEYSGEILDYNIAPITISLLKGLLTPILNESVNFINAPVIAKERGIKVVESRSSEMKDYTSMISVTIKTAKAETTVAGAIFGRQEPRIVRINRFTVEAIPEGRMLVLYNNDKPGVIGNIGTTLGENGVNIARLHLSREQVDGQAMVVLGTDSVVSPELLEKLRKLPNMISVTELEM
ncbi:MAG: phosphoglycerate dehydrogenase [Deltaproteobacteria bacterium]|nr:phosphoglycerate dehydrogenase [Deltaproteobacteria bacterium]